MARRTAGFSLIELMIVVVIIALLAAVAMPLYLRYTTRAEASEALALSTALKPHLVGYYDDHGTFGGASVTNSSPSGYGAEPAAAIRGKYVTSVLAAGGVITATFCSSGDPGCRVNKRLEARRLALSAITHGGSIDWVCKADRSIWPLLPAYCRHAL